MIKAVVDIGTNSTRLLIADITGNEIEVIKTALTTTRIGEGIGEKNILSHEAMIRTVKALQEYKRLVEKTGANNVIITATSAVRDAENKTEFVDMVKHMVGWDVMVISGNQEAELGYKGAITGLPDEYKDAVVVDIGGGSTEFVWSKDKGINSISLKLGAVRMTEKGYNIKDIQKVLAELPEDLLQTKGKLVVGVGGTFTTLAAIEQRLRIYDPDKVQGYKLNSERIKQILYSLESMSLEERKAVPGLQPERADIIVSGVRIAVAVMEILNVSFVTISETDLMYGLLLQ